MLQEILINDIGAEGKAIAKIEGRVLFVPFGIPGDVVDVQVTSARKKYYEGNIVNYHKHAEIKIDPVCVHFGICGGCKWQHLPYRDQLFFKQKQVIDSFERIGKLSDYKLSDILPSENTEYYRNKLEYTFSDSRWLTQKELESGETFNDRTALGFHIPKKFDKILDIEKCHLQNSPSNEIRLAIKDFARKNNYPFFNIIKQEGFLRNLIIRNSEYSELMVILSFFYEDMEKRLALLDFLKDKFPEITSLMYVINPKQNETLFDQDIKIHHGRGHIIEVLDGLKFRIGPKSFYQTNSKQAATLYNSVKELADLKQDDIVYDLYTGTGTIALYLARFCKKAIGLEIIPEAIEDALKNAELNNIKNVHFQSGDVKELLKEDMVALHGKPNVIVVDPPRAGLHPDVVESIGRLKAEKIVYVSCNPATQARDLSLLKHLYKIEIAQPVDMFPHTHHVENIAMMKLI